MLVQVVGREDAIWVSVMGPPCLRRVEGNPNSVAHISTAESTTPSVSLHTFALALSSSGPAFCAAGELILLTILFSLLWLIFVVAIYIRGGVVPWCEWHNIISYGLVI